MYDRLQQLDFSFYDRTILIHTTSAVDIETELQIQKKLKADLEKKTCFIIAHRISSVMEAPFNPCHGGE